MTLNMRRSLSALILAVLVLVPGCASGPAFERVSSVPEDRAVIYIFREARGLGAAAPMGITVNGAAIASLWAGEYAVAHVRPGVVLIEPWGVASLGMGNTYSYFGVPTGRFVSVKVMAGREYFVEIQVGLRLKHHATESPPKELVSAKQATDPRPWESISAAMAAQACNRKPRDQAVMCLQALIKQP